MSDGYVLDAHTLIWFLENNRRLGLRAKAALLDVTARLFVPAIALAEVCWIVDRGRTTIPSAMDVMRTIDSDSRIQIVALDREVVRRSIGLTSVGEIHDRQIVATALELIARGEKVVLLTTDANISSSGLVPIVW
jgi:PIN domain nuclease of toxin-antitoxin system